MTQGANARLSRRRILGAKACESLLDKYHAYCLPIVARLQRSNIATASQLSPTPIRGIPRHAVQTCSQRFPQQRAYSLSSRIVYDELGVRRFSQRKRQHRFSIKRIGKILSQVRGIGQSAALDNGRTRFVARLASLDWNSVVVEQDLQEAQFGVRSNIF